MGVNLEDRVRGNCKHRCVRPKCHCQLTPSTKIGEKTYPARATSYASIEELAGSQKKKHNGKSTYNPSVESQFLLKSHAQWRKFFWDTCSGKLTVHREPFQGPSIPGTIRNRTCRGVVFTAVRYLNHKSIVNHLWINFDHVHQHRECLTPVHHVILRDDCLLRSLRRLLWKESTRATRAMNLIEKIYIIVIIS